MNIYKREKELLFETLNNTHLLLIHIPPHHVGVQLALLTLTVKNVSSKYRHSILFPPDYLIEKMVTIEKKPQEELGIITEDVRSESVCTVVHKSPSSLNFPQYLSSIAHVLVEGDESLCKLDYSSQTAQVQHHSTPYWCSFLHHTFSGKQSRLPMGIAAVVLYMLHRLHIEAHLPVTPGGLHHCKLHLKRQK